MWNNLLEKHDILATSGDPSARANGPLPKSLQTACQYKDQPETFHQKGRRAKTFEKDNVESPKYVPFPTNDEPTRGVAKLASSGKGKNKSSITESVIGAFIALKNLLESESNKSTNEGTSTFRNNRSTNSAIGANTGVGSSKSSRR